MNYSNEDTKQIEQQVTHNLLEGELKIEDPAETAIDRLSHKYEIRIPAKEDPILEETKIIRQTVAEVDDRYDKYIDRAQQDW